MFVHKNCKYMCFHKKIHNFLIKNSIFSKNCYIYMYLLPYKLHYFIIVVIYVTIKHRFIYFL